MANADSIITNSKVISGQFELPRVSMPKDIVVGADGRIFFKIATNCGVIDVTSWGDNRFDCRGTASALEAGGILRSDWCPGLPGNNKTRQTVLFENRGARLIYGNRCGKIMAAPFIVIKRASISEFIVEVPTTKAQGELLSQARESGRQREKDNRRRNEQINEQAARRKEKEEQFRKYHHNPSIFKDDSVSILKIIFNSSMEQLSGKCEFLECGETTIWLDEQSMQEVLSAGARLFEAVRNAKVVCRNRVPHLSIVK